MVQTVFLLFFLNNLLQIMNKKLYFNINAIYI